MSFVDWIPVLRENRPYTTESNVQSVGGCDRCKKCFKNWNLIEYPKISNRPPRRVCKSCLAIDQKLGVSDAIMDIWNNYEEHKGLGHKLTIKDILERVKKK